MSSRPRAGDPSCMNRILAILLVGMAFGSACCREDAYVATSQIATWEFIQSVGGIRIGQPQKRDESTWVLPIACDVSGLKTVTREPTTMHSGLVVTKILHKISGRDISISVVVNAPLGTKRSSACPSITLGEVSAADYRVLYLEPNEATHALGTVTLR
jgi:hypothetical protein